MYLWDTNILRYFVEGHPKLEARLRQIAWTDIALPSVVVAEVLRGRCEHALKALPSQAAAAHQLLMETQQFLQRFNVVVFDERSASVMQDLIERHKSHKRYADMMIAAIALAGKHVLVTRNQRDFLPLLPQSQLTDWIE